jgi:hypothetical protein
VGVTMLEKLVDDILGMIGAALGFFVILVLLGIAFTYFPIITSIVLALGFFFWLVITFELSEEKAGKFLAIVLVISGIIALFYYDYRLALVVLSAFTLGSLIDQRKKIKKCTQNIITHFKKKFNHALNK